MRALLTILTLLLFARCEQTPVKTSSVLKQVPFAGVAKIVANIDGTFTLTWKKPDIKEPASYNIFTTFDTSFTVPIATTNHTSWTSGVLVFNPNTCFVVRAEATGYKDINTASICTKHTQSIFPGLQTLTANTDNSYVLTWTAVPLVSATYDVFVRDEVGGEYDFTTPLATGVATLTYTSAILTHQISKCFLVRAVPGKAEFTDINTTELCSNNVQQPSPPEVSTLIAIPISDTSIGLTWSSGAGSTANYQISYASGTSAPASCALDTILPTEQISDTTAVISGLTANTQYSFRVCATNGNTVPDVSDGTVATATTIQAAPQNLSATSGSGRVTLSWSTVTGASTYAIYYATSAGVTKAATRVVAAAPSYQVTGLSPATTYYFNIAVVFGDVESDLSTHEANSSTFPAAPNKPTTVSLSWAYYKALKVNFSPVTGATSYNLYYKNSAGVSTSDNVVANVSDGYVLSGLNSSGTYYAKIAAVDTYNQESELSSEVSYAEPYFVTLPQDLTVFQSFGSNIIQNLFILGNYFYVATGGGVTISTDGGATWLNKTINNGLIGNSNRRIFAAGNNVYVGSSSGVSLSTNNGATWANKTLANGLGSSSVRRVYASGNTIYASTTGGLSISTDNGTTWINKSTADGLGSTVAYDLSLLNGNIYVATESGGLSTSTDGGATWATKTTTNGLGSNSTRAVYATGNNVYVGSINGISISTDNGASFINKTTTNGIVNNVITDIYAVDNNIYIGTNAGVSISTNAGTTWANSTSANGIANTDVRSVHLSANTIYAATAGGLAFSTNNGTTWTNTLGTNGTGSGRTLAAQAFGSNIYIATQGGLSISTNNGLTWINKTTAHGLGSIDVRSLYMPSASNIYAATINGVSISTNGGSTWLNKTTTSGLANNTVNGIYYTNSTIYAATSGGLSVSTNEGTSWTNKTTTNGLGSNTVNGVYYANSSIYAATGGGLSISSDNGTTWATKTTTDGLGDNSVKALYVINSNIYAATLGGVSLSTDNGTTWINKNTSNGIPSNSVNAIYVSDNIIYAGTTSGLSLSSDSGSTWLGNKTTGIGDAVLGVYVSGNIIYASTHGGLTVSGL